MLTSRELPIEDNRIVVGIDGSASSKSALAWAARQAELTHTPLVAIATWEFPITGAFSEYWPENVDLAADASAVLTDAVNEVLGPNPEIELATRVIPGHAAVVLTEESKTASLVVVGCRGHGEFSGMLLGSVSEFLATHAHCPVMIVRDHGDD